MRLERGLPGEASGAVLCKLQLSRAWGDAPSPTPQARSWLKSCKIEQNQRWFKLHLCLTLQLSQEMDTQLWGTDLSPMLQEPLYLSQEIPQMLRTTDSPRGSTSDHSYPKLSLTFAKSHAQL